MAAENDRDFRDALTRDEVVPFIDVASSPLDRESLAGGTSCQQK